MREHKEKDIESTIGVGTRREMLTLFIRRFASRFLLLDDRGGPETERYELLGLVLEVWIARNTVNISLGMSCVS